MHQRSDGLRYCPRGKHWVRPDECYLYNKKKSPGYCKQCTREHLRERRKAEPEKIKRGEQSFIARRFFAHRARIWRRRIPGLTAWDLARIWINQHGRCVLSGVKLGRDAELDHITPKSLGGPDCLSNLRWVSKEANRARGILSDQEFISMCRTVAAYHQGA